MVQHEPKPSFAIIAFVSVPEKERFDKAFAEKSISYPTAITMGEKLLACRPFRPKSQSVPARFQETMPGCGSGNSDRGSLSSGPRAGGEDYGWRTGPLHVEAVGTGFSSIICVARTTLTRRHLWAAASSQAGM